MSMPADPYGPTMQMPAQPGISPMAHTMEMPMTPGISPMAEAWTPPAPLYEQTLPVLPPGSTMPGMPTIPGIGPDMVPRYPIPGAGPMPAPYQGIMQSVLDMFF